MGIFKRKAAGAPEPPGQKSEDQPPFKVIDHCFCTNGHDLISDMATFNGYAGITLKLCNDHQEGQLSLSPIIGDKERDFFGTEWNQDEVIKICCPTCSESLPVYNECFCGADLVAIFTTSKNDFANCIGICQRIGCTHAEIISNHDLRVISRREMFF